MRPYLLAGALLAAGLVHAAELAWDPNTLVMIRQGAGYGRMVRLPSGNILCSYTHAGKAWVRASRDQGQTWESEVQVAAMEQGQVANPELLSVGPTRLLCFYNERPRAGSGKPFTIMMAVSGNQGRTWSTPERLYQAGEAFENGCWEPAAIHLPNGEIQLVFANEGPYRSTAEQEITLLRSLDSGETWGPPEMLSFRSAHRDGMPVPLILDHQRGIVVAIEDNGLAGAFKPVILHTTMTRNWREGPISGHSPHRWAALKRALPAAVYAGAPYIRQMPSGTTVLSIQRTEGGRRQPHMVVYLGDRDAKHFTAPSIPFKLGPDIGGMWNALFVKGSNTVTAISSTTVRGVRGLWAIDGTIRNESGE